MAYSEPKTKSLTLIPTNNTKISQPLLGSLVCPCKGACHIPQTQTQTVDRTYTLPRCSTASRRGPQRRPAREPIVPLLQADACRVLDCGYSRQGDVIEETMLFHDLDAKAYPKTLPSCSTVRRRVWDSSRPLKSSSRNPYDFCCVEMGVDVICLQADSWSVSAMAASDATANEKSH